MVGEDHGEERIANMSNKICRIWRVAKPVENGTWWRRPYHAHVKRENPGRGLNAQFNVPRRVWRRFCVRWDEVASKTSPRERNVVDKVLLIAPCLRSRSLPSQVMDWHGVVSDLGDMMRPRDWS